MQTDGWWIQQSSTKDNGSHRKGSGVGKTAGSQQWQGGPIFGGMTDGDARAAKQKRIGRHQLQATSMQRRMKSW